MMVIRANGYTNWFSTPSKYTAQINQGYYWETMLQRRRTRGY
jgi:hypothetical protein